MEGEVGIHALDLLVEDFLVDYDSKEVGKVVQWQVLLDDLAQRPESILFVSHLREQVRCDKIHPLEVAYLGIALDEADENVAELRV